MEHCKCCKYFIIGCAICVGAVQAPMNVQGTDDLPTKPIHVYGKTETAITAVTSASLAETTNLDYIFKIRKL